MGCLHSAWTVFTQLGGTRGWMKVVCRETDGSHMKGNNPELLFKQHEEPGALAAPVPHILVFLAGGGIPSLFRLVFLALSSAVCRLSTWTPAPCRPAEREPAKHRTCVTFAGARLYPLLST
ncbi:hypothetical protein XENOCAPTIV_010316 [Xenoophorus captivus]|uniref:Uncharacterized protein n=1 Tax=Xenoophorus captivus TaxID=1517983 RepID=A0ABV0QA45_9TELE